MSGRLAVFPEWLPAVSFLTPYRLHLGQGGRVNPDPAVLVHLCSADQWSAAQTRGVLDPEPSAGAGFIHLSTPGQVHLPANRLFRGRVDLVLLHIDPSRLDAPVLWEPGVKTDPESMLFPHLYGSLPVGAVFKVTDYRPGPDGTFPVAAASA